MTHQNPAYENMSLFLGLEFRLLPHRAAEYSANLAKSLAVNMLTEHFRCKLTKSQKFEYTVSAFKDLQSKLQAVLKSVKR